MMTIYFIRHGKTPGNLLRRFIGGRTDQSLCEAGKAELADIKKAKLYPDTKKVYVSPMLRCRETASILFPAAEQIVVEDMREMDFGRFENKSHADMEQDREYKAWLSTMCEGPVPQGEDKMSFTIRCTQAFLDIANKWSLGKNRDQVVFVIHGGTIMAILSSLIRSDRQYHQWYAENGHGYRCGWDGKELTLEKEL